MSDSNGALGPEGSYYDAKRKSQADEEERKRAERKRGGEYPLFITGLFLILGFVFHLWHPGWLLFLTIPLYYMNPRTEAERWLNPVMITLIYLVMGFFFHLWHPGWMIFLAIPASAMMKKKKSDE